MNRTLFKLLVLIISFLLLTSCSKSSPDDLKWHNFEKAVKLAAKQDKPIMVDFFADWCHWCYELDRKTFNAPEVKEYLKEHFILTRLNADSRLRTIRYQGDLLSPYDLFMSTGSTGLPTVVFLDSGANFIYTQPGFHEKDFYIGLLKTLIESIEKVRAEQEGME